MQTHDISWEWILSVLSAPAVGFTASRVQQSKPRYRVNPDACPLDHVSRHLLRSEPTKSSVQRRTASHLVIPMRLDDGGHITLVAPKALSVKDRLSDA